MSGHESTTQLLHQTLLGDAWANAQLPVAVYDESRRIVAVNDAYCRVAGCTREALIGAAAPTGDHVAVDTTIGGRPAVIALGADGRGHAQHAA